jgi:hypothetical protein
MLKSVTILIICIIGVTALHASDLTDANGWWFSPGITISKSGSSPYLGGELSILHIGDKPLYGGIFADCGYLPPKHTMRAIVGPEFGFLIAGVDGGALFMRNNGKIYYGYSVRPYIAIPVFISLNLFYRRNQWKESGSWKGENEYGFQLKFPIPLGDQL